MVEVRETYQSGERKIIVHNSDPEDAPTVYTEEEAREIKQQLKEII